jgi:hypothetical protein
MKDFNNDEFEINKTTMRDLTPYELDEVAGAGTTRLTLTILTLTSPACLTTTTTTTTTTGDDNILEK